MDEKCNCSQAVFYREISRDLAKKVLKFNGVSDNYFKDDKEFWDVLRVAALVLRKTDRRMHNGKK